MRSQKIRLKLTKEQERLAWWYSKVSRNFWNLLVDIDKQNNKGEFDEILSKMGTKPITQISMIEISIALIHQIISTLRRLWLLRTMRKTPTTGLGIINPTNSLSTPFYLGNW